MPSAAEIDLVAALDHVQASLEPTIERRVRQLIVLLNSDAFRSFYDGKRRQLRAEIAKIREASQRSVMESLVCIRHLLTETGLVQLLQPDGLLDTLLRIPLGGFVDRDIVEAIENEKGEPAAVRIQAVWDGIRRSITRRSDHTKLKWGNATALRREFNERLEQGERDSEHFLDGLKKDFQPLAFALRRVQDQMYPRLEKFIVDYLRGNHTDTELYGRIEREELEKDLEHFQTCLQHFCDRAEKTIADAEFPRIPENVAVHELKRGWLFLRSLITGDAAAASQHTAALSEMVQMCWEYMRSPGAENGGAAAATAKSPDRARAKQDDEIAKTLRTEVQAILGVYVRYIGEKSEADGTVAVEFEIMFDGQSVKKFMSHATKLANLSVACVMIGDFGLSIGESRVTNANFNRIYGNLEASGYRTTEFTYLYRGNEKYWCPTGWRRIALNVCESAKEFDRKYSGWHVAYHGTNHELAGAILSQYSGHPRYAEPWLHNGKWFQMVFQVRVRPDSIYKKAPGTLSGAFPTCPTAADPNFPGNQNLEWLVKPIPGKSLVDVFQDAKSIVIYGIMLRVTDKHPFEELPNTMWWGSADGRQKI
ncbi:hypothetical protein DFJ73DRAFT_926133 [Zopfochytrium polystomum]|nr:hypothetical protein DFJ73DRAFT_926133 [Zopfochytrium polystomum]